VGVGAMELERVASLAGRSWWTAAAAIGVGAQAKQGMQRRRSAKQPRAIAFT
jgi:hypothetical protein